MSNGARHTWGFFVGVVLTAALALVRALELFEQWKWPFWIALVAAFAFAALIISTFVEGYQWSLLAVAGATLGTLGMIVALRARQV